MGEPYHGHTCDRVLASNLDRRQQQSSSSSSEAACGGPGPSVAVRSLAHLEPTGSAAWPVIHSFHWLCKHTVWSGLVGPPRFCSRTSTAAEAAASWVLLPCPALVGRQQGHSGDRALFSSLARCSHALQGTLLAPGQRGRASCRHVRRPQLSKQRLQLLRPRCTGRRVGLPVQSHLLPRAHALQPRGSFLHLRSGAARESLRPRTRPPAINQHPALPPTIQPRPPPPPTHLRSGRHECPDHPRSFLHADSRHRRLQARRPPPCGRPAERGAHRTGAQAAQEGQPPLRLCSYGRLCCLGFAERLAGCCVLVGGGVQCLAHCSGSSTHKKPSGQICAAGRLAAGMWGSVGVRTACSSLPAGLHPPVCHQLAQQCLPLHFLSPPPPTHTPTPTLPRPAHPPASSCPRSASLCSTAAAAASHASSMRSNPPDAWRVECLRVQECRAWNVKLFRGGVGGGGGGGAAAGAHPQESPSADALARSWHPELVVSVDTPARSCQHPPQHQAHAI